MLSRQVKQRILLNAYKRYKRWKDKALVKTIKKFVDAIPGDRIDLEMPTGFKHFDEFKGILQGGYLRGEIPIFSSFARASQGKSDMRGMYDRLKKEMLHRPLVTIRPSIYREQVTPDIEMIIGLDPGDGKVDLPAICKMIKTRTGPGPSEFTINFEDMDLLDLPKYGIERNMPSAITPQDGDVVPMFVTNPDGVLDLAAWSLVNKEDTHALEPSQSTNPAE